jgi:hypothetical protein
MPEDDLRASEAARLTELIETHLAALTPSTNTHVIARAFRHRGIYGRRDKGCDCPLARYLREVLPAGMLAHVGGHHVEVYRDLPNYLGIGMEPPLCRVKLPQRFIDFVYEFDAGRYPSLIDLASLKGGSA